MDTQALKSDLNSKNKNAKCLLPVTYQYRISKSKQEKHFFFFFFLTVRKFGLNIVEKSLE